MRFLFMILLLLAPSVESSAQEVSPNPPWQELPSPQSSTEALDLWQRFFLYVPNRLLDVIDLFRVDLGIGPAFGAVLRITPHGQMGYRLVRPFSLRLGDFGRESPVIIEQHDEGGGAFGSFVRSPDRSICGGELGLGLDVGVGAYCGICFDELWDFSAGLLGFDPKGDDYR